MSTISDISKLIQALDLNNTEGEIYQYLISYGDIRTVDLRKALRFDRSPFYRAISSLEERDLVVVEGSKRLQHVRPQKISTIKSYLQKKSEDIKSAEKSLSTLATSIQQYRDDRYHNKNVEIFSGSDAYLHSMQSVLAGGGKLLRDITPDSTTLYDMAGSKDKYEQIVRVIKELRLKNTIAIQILFDNQAKDIDELSATNPKALKESRIFGGNLHLNCYLNTCGSRSLFYTKDATGSWGIVIKDELITKLLNSLFDILWSQSNKI